mgnify:CR=1 FL=1
MCSSDLIVASYGHNKPQIRCHHSIHGTATAAHKTWRRLIGGQPMLHYRTQMKFLCWSEKRQSTNAVQVVTEGVRHSGWVKSLRQRSSDAVE